MKFGKKILTLGLMGVLALSVLAGCGGTGGTVSTDGSTSMEKVIGALKETFESENKSISVTYNPTGSGSGITAVAEGRCDIGLSSRDLKDEEIAQGLEGTVLAYDGIAIIVNPENPVADLDVETIGKIFTGEITNWSDVGGADAEIVLIGREAGSGTRDGFESITGTKDNCKYRYAQRRNHQGRQLSCAAQFCTGDKKGRNPQSFGAEVLRLHHFRRSGGGHQKCRRSACEVINP